MSASTNPYSFIMEALGWTLLNSVWQAFVLFLVTFIVLRVMPVQLSRVRYAVSCGALAVLVIASVLTFLIVLDSPGLQEPFSFNNAVSGGAPVLLFTNDTTVFDNAFQFLESNMTIILFCWSIGAMLFSMRLVSGWIFLNGIKRDANEVGGEWYDKLQDLAKTFGLTRTIGLAETSRIQVPMVIGFFKPLVLIPTTMLSGLSPAQIETIFVHELAHIRRHDYIINLFQTILESIFFFNPFVWLLSGIIRREREYCCDDEVISRHGEALVYAQALASLEEIRLQQTTLALSLAENKNLLFNRIRRIMEKSAKNSFGRERMIPALLLVVGLVCASWLTIRTDNGEKYLVSENEYDLRDLRPVIVQDTIIKDKKSSSRTTFIRIDEDGNTREEIYEIAEGDEEFDMAFEPIELDAIFDFPTPLAPMSPMDPIALMPPMSIDVPAFPNFPMPIDLPDNFFSMYSDTIPGTIYYRTRNDEDWKEFSKEFEAKFKEQFGDFYKKNEKEFEKMMNEMEQTFSRNFEAHEFTHGDFLESLAAREHSVAAEQEARHAQEQAVQAMGHLREAQVAGHAANADAVQEMHRAMEAQAAAMHARSADLVAAESNMKTFERNLRRMLIEDGYIKSTDEIKSFRREQNGAMEVNGKKIKEADLDRYNALHKKHFKPGFHHWNVE